MLEESKVFCRRLRVDVHFMLMQVLIGFFAANMIKQRDTLKQVERTIYDLL